MALTATVSIDPHVYDTFDNLISPVPIVATETINQGDLLVWDATLNAGNGAARTPVTQADMADYLGVSNGQNPVRSLNDTSNYIPMYNKGVMRFQTTAGEVYTHLQKVFFNETLSVQTITNGTNAGARTVAVGFVCLEPQLIMAGTTSLTGAAGVVVNVFITPTFPAASY